MEREIIDESDVFVDVPRAIRRNMPAPQFRVPKGAIVTDPSTDITKNPEDLIDLNEDQKGAHPNLRRLATSDGPTSNGTANPPIRRSSSIVSNSMKGGQRKPKDQPKNLGPSNLASRPRTTRYNTVKIKPGGGATADTGNKSQAPDSPSEPRRISTSAAPQGGVGAGLLSSAGMDAKDGVMAVQSGYGTMGDTPPKSKGRDSVPDNLAEISPGRKRESSSRKDSERQPSVSRGRASSQSSTVGSMRSLGSRSKSKTGVARSGSLSENVVHAGGIKKTVLETTSSSEEADEHSRALGDGQHDGAGDAKIKDNNPPSTEEGSHSQKKKRRRKKRSAKKGEEQPLMEEGNNQ